MSLPNASSPPVSPSTFAVNPGAIRSATEGGSFVDRRSGSDDQRGKLERRQFGSSHIGLSEDGRELALAIDQYKVRHHRRYLTCDEMLQVLGSLGYSKQST